MNPDARLQTHHAFQIIASFGLTWLPAVDDWSHTSATWSDRHGALVSGSLGDGTRVGLRIDPLTLVVIDSADDIDSSFPLSGVRLEDAYSWLATVMKGRAPDRSIVRPTHQLPRHAVQSGARFNIPAGVDQAELARQFASASRQLERRRRIATSTSPVRCWPHHFDIATLQTLEGSTSRNHLRTIGIGFSPGDGSRPGSYWYITPSPNPEPVVLPQLRSGTWNTSVWFGAVLDTSEIEAMEEQAAAEYVASFIDAATAICRQLLETGTT